MVWLGLIGPFNAADVSCPLSGSHIVAPNCDTIPPCVHRFRAIVIGGIGRSKACLYILVVVVVVVVGIVIGIF